MFEDDYTLKIKTYMKHVENKIKALNIDDKKIKALKKFFGISARLLEFISEVIKKNSHNKIEQLNLNKEELDEIIQALKKLEDENGETGGNKTTLLVSLIKKSITALEDYEDNISKDISNEKRYIKLSESLQEIANILKIAEKTIDDIKTLWDIFKILSKLIYALHPALLHLETISSGLINKINREFGEFDKFLETQSVRIVPAIHMRH